MNNNEKALYALKKYFGFNNFRQGQLNIISNILSKRDTFCIMPTGGGKSICYQIPAIIMPGITLVISPLISLMKDQVDSLRENGINSAYINSSIDNNQIKEILKEAELGAYKLIYIAPERLNSRVFIDIIKDLEISQVAIDEAHCVSEWGHDFRISYRNIRPFINNLKSNPVISAFTATATKEVKTDTINLLSLKEPYIFNGKINRDNLQINIIKQEDKLEGIKDIINNHEDESGIIYCLSRKETESLYDNLTNFGYNVTMYHGGISEELKNNSQEDFLFERKNIMICTNAFGMGIDKSNIRYIIHCTIPKNIEGYYQEIGRGGRDSESTKCYLFYNREDIKRVEYLINKGSKIERREIALRKLQALIDFVEEDKCLWKILINYFQEDYTREYCNNCSNCLKNDEIKDYTRESQMILATVFRTREKYGISVICDILKGVRGPKIIEYKLDKITTFGIMKEYSNSFIKSLIKALLKQGYVGLKEGTYSMLTLNSLSMDILYKKLQVRLLIKEDNPILNKELFDLLKKWRRIIAIRENIRPYIIFSDSTLIEISNSLPEKCDDLIKIRGIGEKKIEKYGDEIIKITTNYRLKGLTPSKN